MPITPEELAGIFKYTKHLEAKVDELDQASQFLEGQRSELARIIRHIRAMIPMLDNEDTAGLGHSEVVGLILTGLENNRHHPPAHVYAEVHSTD